MTLESFHSGGLRSLGTFFDFKGDLFTFTEGFETLTFDGGEMNKHFLSIISLYEAKTLLVIEPFDSTFRHFSNSFRSRCLRSLLGTLL